MVLFEEKMKMLPLDEISDFPFTKTLKYRVDLLCTVRDMQGPEMSSPGI